MDSHARILATMQRLRGPASASHIARLARLPLHKTIDALNRMMADGLVVRVVLGWGQIFYELKEENR